jgi:hypothetical protein
MDRNELVRDVSARFGFAIDRAQVLEHGLANGMLYASMAAGRLPTFADFDAFLQARSEKTLGALIHDLKKHLLVDPGLQGVLAAFRCTLVTNNVRHFSKVPSPSVENWA